MNNNRYTKGTPLTVIWYLRKPDGSPYSLAGYGHKLRCSNSRGSIEITSSGINIELGYVYFTLTSEMQTSTGFYSFSMDLYMYGRLMNTIVENNAIEIIRADTCNAAFQTCNTQAQEVQIYSVGQFNLFAPNAPVPGSDGYWYFDGERIKDDEGHYIPTNVTLRFIDEGEDRGVIIIDEGRETERRITIFKEIIETAEDDHEQATDDHEAVEEAIGRMEGVTNHINLNSINGRSQAYSSGAEARAQVPEAWRGYPGLVITYLYGVDGVSVRWISEQFTGSEWTTADEGWTLYFDKGTLGNYRCVDSVGDLPVNPSEQERRAGYIIDGNMYCYVGTGGDTLGGRYKNVGPFVGPQGIQGPQGPQGVRGPQGEQGNTGSSVDYPFELINNLTTEDAEKGLSAAMGKRLKDMFDAEVSLVTHDAETEVELEDAEPNVLHVWDGPVNSLSVTLAPYDNPDRVNEYRFQFATSAGWEQEESPFAGVTGVRWNEEPVCSPSCTYEVSILYSVGLFVEIENE